MRLIKLISDNRRPNSLASQLRKKRFAFFYEMIKDLPKPIPILDVGGTQDYWLGVGLREVDDFRIVLLNIHEMPTTRPNFQSISGDSRDMSMFNDDDFQIVFSNSVIEHVGDFIQQQKMASEIQRVGKRYFVQTPNKWFPLEPHFLFPCFQFLPLPARVWLATHFKLGWFEKFHEKQRARETIESINLLSKKQLKRLFPNSHIYEEKFLGVTKSFIAYGNS